MGIAYEFGTYRLDMDSRVLTRAGEPVSVTPKVFELLLLLVGSDGRALSREELIRSLWPDSFVEEANLSFQISSLRKALGADGAKCIETLPKHGYRFACKVARIEPAEPQAMSTGKASQQHIQARPRSLWIRKSYSVAALFTAAVLVTGWALHRKGQGHHRLSNTSPLPLTTYPGNEIEPSLSPDGSQVAFSWDGLDQDNFDIYVKLVGPGEPIRLTRDPAPDQDPAWSPDGRFIAFLRYADEVHAAIYLVPALGGSERKLAEVVTPSLAVWGINNLTWSPDGSYLALGCAASVSSYSRICLVPVGSGTQRFLTTGIPRVGDFCPRFSPDGKWLAFIRSVQPTASDVHLQRVAPDFSPQGQPRRLTYDASVVYGLAWAVGGKELIGSVGWKGGFPGLRQIALDGDGPAARSASTSLPFGEDATSLSISRENRTVYARAFSDSNIWTTPISAKGMLQPHLLIASTRDDHNPDYSPDGARLAFASTRSGFFELWTANADGSHPIQLTDLRARQTANPRWSPEGKTILFNSFDESQSDLYTVDTRTGTVQRLTKSPENEVETRWSHDGKWIYYSSDKTGRFEIYRMPARGGEPVQLTHEGGLNPLESVDGRFLYYAAGPSTPTSIWRLPVEGGRQSKILDGLSYSLNYAVGKRGIYFLSLGPKANVCFLEFYDPSTGSRTRLRRVDKDWSWGMALSPDERWLTYSLVDREGSELMLAQYGGEFPR